MELLFTVPPFMWILTGTALILIELILQRFDGDEG
jgi:hypothetical protein